MDRGALWATVHRIGTFSSSVATAEFSKFAGILSAALSQHPLSGFEWVMSHLPKWKVGREEISYGQEELCTIVVI